MSFGFTIYKMRIIIEKQRIWHLVIGQWMLAMVMLLLLGKGGVEGDTMVMRPKEKPCKDLSPPPTH